MTECAGNPPLFEIGPENIYVAVLLRSLHANIGSVVDYKNLVASRSEYSVN
jgi:hypothetical protein